MEENATIARLLQQIYYDPANIGSFSSAWALYTAAKKKAHGDISLLTNLTLRTVRHWLQTQSVHNLYRPVRRKFARRRFRVQRIDEQWQLDLAFLLPFAHWNKGVKYLLFAIDLLSRYLWVEPLKNKTGAAVTVAFQAILNRAAPRQPENIFTDIGGEFRAKQFLTLLKRYHIQPYTRTDHIVKAAVVERNIRTFMIALSKYIHAYGRRYLPVLQTLVQRYNQRVNRSIGMRPVDVRPGDNLAIERAWHNLYMQQEGASSERALLGKYYKYSVGDQVRIAIDRVGNPFYKGYRQQWSDEVYTVAEQKRSLDQPTYRLRDPVTGALLRKAYYEPEIQLIAFDPTIGDGPLQNNEAATAAATQSEDSGIDDDGVTATTRTGEPIPTTFEPKKTRSGKTYGNGNGKRKNRMD